MCIRKDLSEALLFLFCCFMAEPIISINEMMLEFRFVLVKRESMLSLNSSFYLLNLNDIK